MTTNGESATKWLKEQGESATPERLQKIRDSIAIRLEEASLNDQQHIDLLEALDVMDSYLINKDVISKEVAVVGNSDSVSQLDLSPLCENITPRPPLLEENEKQQRFRTLLKTGNLPPVIS